MADTPQLADRLPEAPLTDADEVLDRFLDWVTELGLELYEAQEEALLELMAGRHVVLDTPTGSGKSLVAEGLAFKAACARRRIFYTAPIKALVNEKFFRLCDIFGPERVGMLTGDASINEDADIICCTAEILANMALRDGERTDAPFVVMDEFHFYADPDRGWAWQLPLLALPHSRFLLMSATLGNMAPITERLEARTGVGAVVVSSDERPVPLEFEYRETPIHETVQGFVDSERAPLYVVSFTQRACAELAQALTSLKLADKEHRDRIRAEIAAVRFDTPYGAELKRFLGFGVAVHHAGLLPRYRLLVEQLAQQGLLKVICGTDTLGVGVNIPLRTVVFTGLSKYDGHSERLLTVRELKQIAGRAGRRGFDDKGWVVCQAPEHVIENLKLEEKAKRGKKVVKKQPRAGEVSWSEDTFDRLAGSPPEMLESSFHLTHGMVLDLLRRDVEEDEPDHDNFHALRQTIELCHEADAMKPRLVTQAAELVLSLYRAGIVGLVPDSAGDYRWVTVDEELQIDFALYHVLSLFLVEAIGGMDPEDEHYAFDVVTFAEAILESPRVVLRALESKAKGEAVAQMKAEGIPYEERMNRLDEITHPMPNREKIRRVFEELKPRHPWLDDSSLMPKAIGLEMWLEADTFADFVRRYGLKRSEGVLLRYLSQLYKTLDQNVPQAAHTPEVEDATGYLRTVVETTDASLLEEWESLMDPALRFQSVTERHATHQALLLDELTSNPASLERRLRSELHQLVRALTAKDWETAPERVRPEVREDWTPERFEELMAPFFEARQELRFDHGARLADKTRLEQAGPRQWKVWQTLCDPEEENDWYLEAEVSLDDPESLSAPLIVPRLVTH